VRRAIDRRAIDRRGDRRGDHARRARALDLYIHIYIACIYNRLSGHVRRVGVTGGGFAYCGHLRGSDRSMMRRGDHASGASFAGYRGPAHGGLVTRGVPVAHVRAPRGAVRYYAVYGLGFVRVAEESITEADATAFGSVFVASVLRDDERESMIAARARMTEALMRGEMERVRGTTEVDVDVETPATSMTLPRRFGNIEDASEERSPPVTMPMTPSAPRMTSTPVSTVTVISGSTASVKSVASSASRSGASRRSSPGTSRSATHHDAPSPPKPPKHSDSRIRRNMKRRLERLDVELDALRAYLVDGELVVGARASREDAREALRRAQWRRCEHDLGIARLERRELPPGLLELVSLRSPSVFTPVMCETGGLTSCAFALDGMRRVASASSSSSSSSSLPTSAAKTPTPQSPDDVEDATATFCPEARDATLLPYDFMTETCACDVCVKLFARAMLQRVCVCPTCLVAYSRAQHASDVKNVDTGAADADTAESDTVARKLLFDAGDEARVKQWDAIAKHAGLIAKARLRKRLEALMRALSAAPTPCLPWFE